MAKAKPYRSLGNTDFKKFSESPLGSFIGFMFPNPSRAFVTCFPNRIMRTGVKTMLLQPWFMSVLILATMHQFLQKILGINIQLVDSFLDPLLFLPILLQLVLLERRFVFGKGTQYVLSWFQILTVTVFVSVVCELLFPQWNPAFTADYIDVICYLLGGVIFGVFFNSSPL